MPQTESHPLPANPNPPALDRFGRPLEDLRVSVTDRCNYRCTYCMPLDEYEWIARDQILTFEEIERTARLFAGLGVRKLRLTGGEPLVRKNLDQLIAKLSQIQGIEDICLTTNAARLSELAKPLAQAGLNRVTVSLDTLRPDRFRQITKRGDLEPVLAGLAAAREAGLQPIKLNTVVERGVNDDEILDLVEFARREEYAIRFIEFMDVGNANAWASTKLVPKAEILETIAGRYPLSRAGRERGSAPSVDYAFDDGAGDIGVIASITEPFCGNCTRARLTADGRIVTCLFSETGSDIKTLLRSGASDEELQAFIKDLWADRRDRYSEQRLVALRSPTGYQPSEHRKIEMISLGG